MGVAAEAVRGVGDRRGEVPVCVDERPQTGGAFGRPDEFGFLFGGDAEGSAQRVECRVGASRFAGDPGEGHGQAGEFDIGGEHVGGGLGGRDWSAAASRLETELLEFHQQRILREADDGDGFGDGHGEGFVADDGFQPLPVEVSPVVNGAHGRGYFVLGDNGPGLLMRGA